MAYTILKCPYCGAGANKSAEVSKILQGDFIILEESPVEGSVCICNKCANISQYAENGSLEKMTPKELDQLHEDEPILYEQLGAMKVKILWRLNLE